MPGLVWFKLILAYFFYLATCVLKRILQGISSQDRVMVCRDREKRLKQEFSPVLYLIGEDKYFASNHRLDSTIMSRQHKFIHSFQKFFPRS